MYIVHSMLNTQMQPDSSQISPLKAIHDLARRNKVRNFIRKKNI
jgi:hypothetical protein